MKKYFIVSDTHSYCTVLKNELNKKGFEINNKEHIFVLCGDLFDRGSESIELYNFIISIPKERRILIRGNHEYLFLDLLYKDFPDYYDHTNGTVKTFNDLTNNDKALDYLEKAWFLDQSSTETGEMLAETAKGLGKSVMVDVVGYNVILSEPELAGCIFKFQ